MDTGPRGGRLPLVVAVCVVIVLSWPWALAVNSGIRPFAETDSQDQSNPSLTRRPSANPRLDFDLNLSWLHAPTHYDLFVHSGSAVYRLDARTGRTIRVWIPQIGNDPFTANPGILLPLKSGALIRMAGTTTVYAVPDRGPVRTFRAPGDELAPGPDPDHVWVRQDHRHMALISLDGTPTTTVLQLPKATVGDPQPDGHGYLIAQSRTAVYDIRPRGATRLATGRLVATGPSRLLVADCKQTCRATVLGPELTVVKTLQVNAKELLGSGFGVTSPDGRYAALAAPNNPSNNPITLLDLTTGSSRRLFATVSWQILVPGSGQLAFSPDGRWLFAIDQDANLEALDTSCTAADMCVSSHTLPPLGAAQQVAIRP